VDKGKGAVPLVLTDGEIDEIAENIQGNNTKTWENIDDRYKVILAEV